jgi:hypothetical protein
VADPAHVVPLFNDSTPFGLPQDRTATRFEQTAKNGKECAFPGTIRAFNDRYAARRKLCVNPAKYPRNTEPSRHRRNDQRTWTGHTPFYHD